MFSPTLIELNKASDFEKLQEGDHIVYDFMEDRILYFSVKAPKTLKVKFYDHKIILKDFTLVGVMRRIKEEYPRRSIKQLWIDNRKLEKDEQIRFLERGSRIALSSNWPLGKPLHQLKLILVICRSKTVGKTEKNIVCPANSMGRIFLSD